MTSDNRPIGVFDSGLGGLTVVRALRREMPDEGIIYFGDTARVPYGTKSPTTVRRYALEAACLLTRYDVKAIVVACNTASAHGLAMLEERFDVPVFGVIEPGVRAAMRASERRCVLVIGTHGTVRSEAYQRALQAAGGSEMAVWSQPCALFVPLVEEGMLDGEIAHGIVAHYLARYRKTDVDAVILGCTHYPLLKSAIATVLPGVTLVDSGVETAASVRDARAFLPADSGRAAPTRYILSDFTEGFLKIGERFLGEGMHHVEVLDFDRFLIEHAGALSDLNEDCGPATT